MPLYSNASIIATYLTFTVICIALTCVRFLLRIRDSYSTLGTDDWLILVAVVIVTTCTALQIYNTVDGSAGSATTAATRAALVEHKLDFTQVVIEKVAYGTIKLSILFFYRRIFRVWKSFRILNNALIALVTVWTITFLITELCTCGDNLSAYWDPDQLVARRECDNHGAVLVSFAVTDVFTDILIIGIPLFYLQRLQMPSRQKWGIAAVFLLGFVSTLAGILRLIFLAVAYPAGRLTFGYSPPPATATPRILQVINPTFWTMIEMFLGIWAANLPPLAPLIHRVKPAQLFDKMYRKLSLSHDTVNSKTEVVKDASKKRPSYHEMMHVSETAPKFEETFRLE